MSRANGLGLVVAAAAAVALAGCATGSYLWYRAFPDYPDDESETFEVAGLSRPVRVYLDDAGVAHIDAQNDEDLMRAVGFVQARDRFFEMDMLRRFARGRLSELLGEQKVPTGSTVDVDLSMRGWGFDRAAADDVKQIDAATRKLLDAYAAGVNRGREIFGPLEYRLLRVSPEPWTVEDTFAVGRLNAWSVTHNWHQELSRLILALNLGLDRAEKIYPHDYWRGGTSIPAKDPAVAFPPAVAEPLKAIFPERPCLPGEKREPPHAGAALLALDVAAASNSWVVSGEMSASGRPIVANDPHMAHLLPSIVYQQHLRAPGVDVIGVTVVGLPWVLAGHNRHVGWSMTSLVADAVDLYVERVNPKDPDEYETPAGMKAFGRDEHVIGRRTGSSMTEKRVTVRSTIHGPIVNDMYPGLLPAWAPPVALRWDTTGTAASIDALSRADRAATVEELRAALSGVTTPATTWTAADDRGTIAIFATGALPVRKGHLGTFPAPGWSACCDWSGKVEPGALPAATATTGFFAHANNLMIDPSKSRVFVNVDSAPSYRYDRIADLVGATKKHTWRTLSAIQRDTKLLRAQRLVPIILSDLKAAPDLSAVEKTALGLLEKWDFVAGVDSAAAAIFFSTYREAIIGALEDEVDPRGFEFILAQRYSTNVADMWFDSPDHVVWDNRCTPAKETRKDVVTAAFGRAVASLAGAQGADPAKWRWGALHDMQPRHLFGGQKAIADLVNLPRIEAAGGLDSVWKSHFDLASAEPFHAMAGPVYRQVVDLADLDHGHWIIDTGASGWPGSPHYGDQHEKWKRGELIPMLYNWDEIAAKAKAVIDLVP